MANRMARTQRFSLEGRFALATAAALPFVFVACAGADPTPQNVGQTPYGAPSAAPYGQAPGAPAGYPSAAAPGYPAPGATAPPGYAQQPPPPGTPGVPSPTSPQSPLGPIMTTDPAQLQAMFAQAAQAAQAFLQPPGAGSARPAGSAAPTPAAPGGGNIPGGIPSDLVSAGIAAAAMMEAKGMQPEGNQAKGQLAEGGHLEFMVPMQAGKCYTLIGFSPPGQVRNLDLNLLAPPFYNMLAGQDTTDDNVPVIGKSPNPMCPIVPVPLNYKVDIVARAGAGQVGVQLFSRTK